MLTKLVYKEKVEGLKTYLVRQPIMDAKQKMMGYEIIYNGDAIECSDDTDDILGSTVEGFLMQAKDRGFLEEGKVFFTFSPNLISKKIPELFSKDKLIIQIDEATLLDSDAKKKVCEYHRTGYKVALCDFTYSPRHFNTLDFVDIFKLNFNSFKKKDNIQTFLNIVSLAKNFDKEIIAYNINNQSDYDYARKMQLDYYQGSAVCKEVKIKSQNFNYLQSNFFLLLVEVTQEEPDLDKIEELISRDVTLTYSLLRLVNSAYFAMSSKVQSVRQALGVLGISQLKSWIYLLTFKNGKVDVSNELIRISFLRGSFCYTLIPFAKEIGISQSEGYLMGMFSTLDILMDAPLQEVLDELPIDPVIKKALIEKEGTCGKLFDLVLSYEQANWHKMTELSGELQIPLNILTQKYFECVESVNETWNALIRE